MVVISESIFTGNTAPLLGSDSDLGGEGAVAMTHVACVAIRDSFFTGNYAASGAAITILGIDGNSPNCHKAAQIAPLQGYIATWPTLFDPLETYPAPGEPEPEPETLIPCGLDIRNCTFR